MVEFRLPTRLLKTKLAPRLEQVLTHSALVAKWRTTAQIKPQ